MVFFLFLGRGCFAFEHFSDALVQPFFADGFEQIIERIDFKGLERVFIVCRGKNDLWGLVERFEQLKPVASRHLNIEKKQVGPQFGDLFFRLVGIHGLAHDLNLLIIIEHRDQFFPGQSFIIYYQCFHIFFV